MRNPDFDNLLKVLQCKEPDRPTLFEFFLNRPLYEKLAGFKSTMTGNSLLDYRLRIHAYKNAGYDYTTVLGSSFAFPTRTIEQKKTRSLNQGAVISDCESFTEYPWPEPDEFDYSALNSIREEIPEGMKLIVWGPGGVLENVIALVGYDRLCYMIVDDPKLAQDIFDAVGQRLLRYYEICSEYDTVGALISNDDWGFKTQTMLAPSDMVKYVFPWHKRIVEAIHSAGKPAILHSCGNLDSVMEYLIDEIGYDGKHSYEDSIMPVEEAYERWHGKIAVLGGIDLDFICRSSPETIKERCREMLRQVKGRGGYALGTGNSVPEYVPVENYMAMISVVNEHI
jgi:uroporphyrinogen decarboxylase